MLPLHRQLLAGLFPDTLPTLTYLRHSDVRPLTVPFFPYHKYSSPSTWNSFGKQAHGLHDLLYCSQRLLLYVSASIWLLSSLKECILLLRLSACHSPPFADILSNSPLILQTPFCFPTDSLAQLICRILSAVFHMTCEPSQIFFQMEFVQHMDDPCDPFHAAPDPSSAI